MKKFPNEHLIGQFVLVNTKQARIREAFYGGRDKKDADDWFKGLKTLTINGLSCQVCSCCLIAGSKIDHDYIEVILPLAETKVKEYEEGYKEVPDGESLLHPVIVPVKHCSIANGNFN